jgi:hypothetical protein
MLAPAANDNYPRRTRAERIENVFLLAIGIPASAAFWFVLAYGVWRVLAG